MGRHLGVEPNRGGHQQACKKQEAQEPGGELRDPGQKTQAPEADRANRTGAVSDHAARDNHRRGNEDRDPPANGTPTRISLRANTARSRCSQSRGHRQRRQDRSTTSSAQEISQDLRQDAKVN